jgi:serine phosphatase RsbU (regulator of sigma subunit)
VTNTLVTLKSSYSAAFEAYLANRSEEALHAAYELGRAAVAARVNMLDLSGTHHDVLLSVLRRTSPEDIELVTEAAASFFLQTLSAFEMVQRGFREAQETVLLEKQHAAQLQQLSKASVAINSRRSLQETLQTATEEARDVIGAQCSITSLVGEGNGFSGHAISCPEGQSEWRRLSEAGLRAIQAPDASFPLRMNEAALAEDVTWRALLRSLAVGRRPRSWLAAPLRERRDSIIGSIQLFDKLGGEFSEKDESILVQLAQVTSVAIENRRLYERDHRIAEGLQRRLLLQELPEIPELRMAMRYLPGAAGVSIGGDWFDAITLPGGRSGIAVGDVVGRGVRAASVMGQIRTAFRAYALRGASPQSVVGRLNRLIPTLDPDHFSTMIYLVWDPRERLARLVRAGHPPPLIARPGRPPEYLDTEVAVPLGVMPDASYGNVRVELEPGTMMVFYTDGLVEQEEALGDGLERLKRSIPSSTSDLEVVCDRVLELMPASGATDDVALLVVRFD